MALRKPSTAQARPLGRVDCPRSYAASRSRAQPNLSPEFWKRSDATPANIHSPTTSQCSDCGGCDEEGSGVRLGDQRARELVHDGEKLVETAQLQNLPDARIWPAKDHPAVACLGELDEIQQRTKPGRTHV